MDDKTELRREVKRLKSAMPEDERLRRSAAVWALLETTPRFIRAAAVLLYWSMPDEPHTHNFIRRWSSRKTIILPVIDGDSLRLVPFSGDRALRRNTSINLYEPCGDDFPTPLSIETAIIPGVAFDRHNHRMGRGRGYYDRMLPQLHTYNIGVGFDFQLFDLIPFDAHDVPMDEVLVG